MPQTIRSEELQRTLPETPPPPSSLQHMLHLVEQNSVNQLFFLETLFQSSRKSHVTAKDSSKPHASPSREFGRWSHEGSAGSPFHGQIPHLTGHLKHAKVLPCLGNDHMQKRFWALLIIQRPIKISNAFLPFVSKMADTIDYLNHAALVEALGRPVKVDDVVATRTRKPRLLDHGQPKKLPGENLFMVLYPSNKVIHSSISHGHISAEGFSLLVYPRDVHKEGIPIISTSRSVPASLTFPLLLEHRVLNQCHLQCWGPNPCQSIQHKMGRSAQLRSTFSLWRPGRHPGHRRHHHGNPHLPCKSCSQLLRPFQPSCIILFRDMDGNEWEYWFGPEDQSKHHTHCSAAGRNSPDTRNRAVGEGSQRRILDDCRNGSTALTLSPSASLDLTHYVKTNISSNPSRLAPVFSLLATTDHVPLAPNIPLPLSFFLN